MRLPAQLTIGFKTNQNARTQLSKLFHETRYIEDITRWREDMNFLFEWQEQSHE